MSAYSNVGEPRGLAPGWPGIPARWTSSAKHGVGTAVGAGSRVWFTLSHGIVNEVYYPRVDSACTRDCGLIITDGAGYFSEEKRHTRSTVALLAPGVPAFHLDNVSFDGRYRVEKEVLTDPAADVLLQRMHLHPIDPADDLRVFLLLAPHLHNHGAGNTAWVGDYKGVPMLFAERDGHVLALAASIPWRTRSVGFVGSSDGWRQLHAHGSLIDLYARAENGNVALTAEIPARLDGPWDVALGFGTTANEAGQRAAMSLLKGFAAARARYISRWQRWQGTRAPVLAVDSGSRPLVDLSVAILRVHESKSVNGGVIASLSIPWGSSKGDADLGGYHLVWPRDLVEAGGGFLAAGAFADARRVLRFLQGTQERDGHWAQNMWLDGTPYWDVIQMDEAALPILLVDLAERMGALSVEQRRHLSPMIQRAAGFIVRNGPVSPQDRWEEDAGYSPFTVGAEIAALLIAADDAEANGASGSADYLRDTADVWYAALDDWLYVTDTALTNQCSVDGYYVRVAGPEGPRGHGIVPIKNRPSADSTIESALMISTDALALVRFGVRAPNDPRILNTVAVIDALLKVETPRGPAWRRYNGDGYGEQPDGRPFDGTGVGRAWPLLTGERAHYELAAGRREQAIALADAMDRFAGEGLLLPEQVWDGPDIPERELFAGAASGSARPLVWAHAEYLKLRRSLGDGHVFDQPPQTMRRYLVEGHVDPRYRIWRFDRRIDSVTAGDTLRVEVLAAARVHWSTDNWTHVHDSETRDTGFGIHVVDIGPLAEPPATAVRFTFFWLDAARWEGADVVVPIAGIEVRP